MRNPTMQPFQPDFELVKMDAEIGSYQEDQDPERDYPEGESAATPATPHPSEPDV
jgi:hypothetical protein